MREEQGSIVTGSAPGPSGTVLSKAVPCPPPPTSSACARERQL